MKKLLYLPLVFEGSNNEQKFLEKAFRKHFKVQTFNFMEAKKPDDEFLTLVQQFRPDIIHCQFQGTSRIHPRALASIKTVYPETIITQWTGDVRVDPIPEVVEYGKVCDLTLVASTTDIGEYERAGVKKAMYWQNAVDISQLKTSTQVLGGITFCGGRYTVFPNSEQRAELVERFRKEFLNGFFQPYGFGWLPHQVIPWDEQGDLYAKSFISLGHHNILGKRWWFSDRQLIAMAAGRPHLCQYTEGLEEQFTDMEHCVFYRSIDEAVEKAKWLLAHPVEATKIGLQGQQKIKEEHLWPTRVKEYLKLLKSI